MTPDGTVCSVACRHARQRKRFFWGNGARVQTTLGDASIVRKSYTLHSFLLHRPARRREGDHVSWTGGVERVTRTEAVAKSRL